MLKAIKAGKSGRIPEGVMAGDPWSSAIKSREDLLTSFVFERLAYLRPSTFWSILRVTFGPVLSDYRMLELETLEFWPRWNDPTTGGTVEPDIFAEFTVGDPSTKIAIIFEAKLGQHQYAEQWRRQWEAYQSLLEEGEADADQVLLLAIGGLAGHRVQVVERLKHTISTETSGAVSMNVAAADWRRLADVVFDQISNAVPPDNRILEDVAEALAMFGYRHVHSLSSLAVLPAPSDGVAALEILRNWKLKHV